MSRTLGAIAIALVALVAAPARAQLLEDYRFKGSVADTSGAPLADVSVTLRDVASGKRVQFKSEKDGSFDRRMIPHAVYEVVFEKEGYEPFRERFDWSVSGETTIVKEAKVVLMSLEEKQKLQAEKAKAELGKKIGKLYQETYAALTSGDCPTATAKAEEMMGLGAGSFEYAVRFVIARCLGVQGKLDASIEEYRKVTGLKPDLFEAHFDLAGVLEQKGLHDDALAAYGRAAELKPSDAETQYAMGAILFKTGKFEAAKPHLASALELDPKHAQAAKALGFSWLSADAKDFGKAAVALESYLALEPAAPDAEQIRAILKDLKR